MFNRQKQQSLPTSLLYFLLLLSFLPSSVLHLPSPFILTLQITDRQASGGEQRWDVVCSWTMRTTSYCHWYAFSNSTFSHNISGLRSYYHTARTVLATSVYAYFILENMLHVLSEPTRLITLINHSWNLNSPPKSTRPAFRNHCKTDDFIFFQRCRCRINAFHWFPNT